MRLVKRKNVHLSFRLCVSGGPVKKICTTDVTNPWPTLTAASPCLHYNHSRLVYTFPIIRIKKKSLPSLSSFFSNCCGTRCIIRLKCCQKRNKKKWLARLSPQERLHLFIKRLLFNCQSTFIFGLRRLQEINSNRTVDAVRRL